MNALTIKDPADLLSFIGHTLGFWPQESLVCITLDKGKVGATLRIDLPRHPGTELPYARTVSSYLTSDTSATSIVFALYTSTPLRTRPAQAACSHHRRTHRSPCRKRHHHPRRNLRRRRHLLPLRQRTRTRHQPAPQHH